MSKTIWKYQLSPTILEFEIPKNATVLHVDNQFENICMWCEVDPTNELESRTFEIFGTGHNIHEDMGVSRQYLGSVKMQDGTFIFHVYERLN